MEKIEVYNEEHLRIIHDLEEVENQSSEVALPEVMRMSQLGLEGYPITNPI